MLLTRIKTAFVLMVAVLAAILAGGVWLKLLLLAAYVQINYELLGFYPLEETRRRILTGFACALPFGYLAYGFAGALGGTLLFATVGFASEVVAAEQAQHEVERVESLGLIALVLGYTGLFGTALVAGVSGATRVELFFVLFSVIAADSCAYFAGRAFGGPKLSPRISPKKTISGALGGLAGAALAAALCTIYSHAQLPFQWPLAVVLGLLIGILSIFGDLIESLVKRCYGVKDSGQLLPGHGGLLDRVDALLFVAPILFLLRAWSNG